MYARLLPAAVACLLTIAACSGDESVEAFDKLEGDVGGSCHKT